MSATFASRLNSGGDDVRRPKLAWLGALLLATTLALAFGWFAEEVVEGDTTAFDRHVTLMARVPGDPSRPLGPAWPPETLRDLTSLGSTVAPGLVVLSVVGYLAGARKRAAVTFVPAAVAGGQLPSTLLKLAFARPRPSLIPDVPEVFTASFPSGHAMLSAVTYLTLSARLARIETRAAVRQCIMAFGICLTILVGCGRVALGVHWPTDVLAGWIVGSAWTLLCAAVSARVRRRGDGGPLT